MTSLCLLHFPFDDTLYDALHYHCFQICVHPCPCHSPQVSHDPRIPVDIWKGLGIYRVHPLVRQAVQTVPSDEPTP